ncbi:MAG TPA: hypothetical protein VGN98_02595, partial [Tianweitania sediminis]|nr:hypothetical protein [Tianweitania sediminis]
MKSAGLAINNKNKNDRVALPAHRGASVSPDRVCGNVHMVRKGSLPDREEGEIVQGNQPRQSHNGSRGKQQNGSYKTMAIRKVVASLVLALACFSTAASAQNLRFGAGQQGSQNYGVNAALAQAIDANSDLTVTVQAFGGPTAFLPLLNSGELDISAVVTPDAGDAIRGPGPF